MKNLPTLIVSAGVLGLGLYHFWPQSAADIAELDGKPSVDVQSSTSNRSVRSSGEEQVVLTREEIMSRFPKGIFSVGARGFQPGHEEALDMFRQLGALEGENALDLIMEHYGSSANVSTAMALAVTGWMELDYDAAIAGFQKMVKADSSLSPPFVWLPRQDGDPEANKEGHVSFHSVPSLFLFQWKGKSFHSGLT